MIRSLAIFDVDGTLVNLGNAIDFDTLLVQAFREHGVAVPPLAERDTLWRAGKDHAILLRSWGVRDPRQFWDIFDRMDYDARSAAIREGKITLFPDTIPALTKLHASGEVVLAVHTNTPIKLARYQLEHFAIVRYFDAILALDIDGYDQARAKPEPWGIHHLQEMIGASRGKDFRGHVAFIGDSRIDMEAARTAGVPGILVNREKQPLPSKSQFAAVNTLATITSRHVARVIKQFNIYLSATGTKP